MENFSRYDNVPFKDDLSSSVKSYYSGRTDIQGIYNFIWTSLSSLILLLILSFTSLHANERKRIVPLTQGITEILYFLGEEKNIVAVPEKTFFPPTIKNLPNFGPFYRPDIEKIIKFYPTHVIGVEYHRNILYQLQTLGVKTLKVKDTTIEDILTSIEKIGAFLNKIQEGRILKEKIVSCINKVRYHSKKRIPVFLILDAADNRFFTAGEKSFISQILELAGGENVMKTSIPYPQVSIEEIVKTNPEVILNLSRKKLDSIHHFIRAKIVNIYDPLLTIPGPRIPLAVELIEKALGLRKEVENCLK